MDWETFKAAIDSSTGYVTIGGGEPTLHPDFEKFLLYAIAHSEPDGGLLIITNGSQKDRALALAALAKRGIINAAVSQDEFHDPIDPEVVQAFTKDKRYNRDHDPYHRYDPDDLREIRNTSSKGSLVRAGRAARREFRNDYGYALRNDCMCEGDPFVLPDGTVKQCGCPKSPTVGNVLTGFDPIDGEWRCYKKLEKVTA